MAIYAPSESPAVVTKEIDLTNGVPNVQSSTGVIAGNFRWGPCNEPILINNEGNLVATFGSPSTASTIDFHSATSYLKYSNNLYVIRGMDSDTGKNAFEAGGSPARTAPTVENDAEFDTMQSGLDSDTHTMIAKYPGILGSSIGIQLVGSNAAASDAATYHQDFNAWAYKDNFDTGPGTSAHTAAIGGVNDEVHVVITDTTGDLSGTKNSILETYPYVSQALGAQNADGTNNYIVDVINQRSQYVRMTNLFTSMGTGAGAVATTSSDMKITGGAISKTLGGGGDGDALGQDDYTTAYNTVNDTAQHQVDFLIAPSLNSSTDHVSLVNHLVTIAASTRKDCMVFASPMRTGVVNTSATANATILSGLAGLTKSSYLSVDNAFFKMYDKYNDNYIQVPAAASTAGLTAATDTNFAPWVSPAGTRRGQYFGVTALNYNPNKIERDSLYRAGINPVTNFPGQGIMLFGDKTHLNRPSAFDRINVRRLFLVIERAIAEAAKNILFEFNDEFTRAEFVNIVEPLLRNIKGRRGISDYKLVADTTNNTPAIIDTNQFVASLFIKPARSINFITLNFVAVRTGVSFEEVVGSAT
jgi:phage tail sheath protein FI